MAPLSNSKWVQVLDSHSIFIYLKLKSEGVKSCQWVWGSPKQLVGSMWLLKHRSWRETDMKWNAQFYRKNEDHRFKTQFSENGGSMGPFELAIGGQAVPSGLAWKHGEVQHGLVRQCCVAALRWPTLDGPLEWMKHDETRAKPGYTSYILVSI